MRGAAASALANCAAALTVLALATTPPDAIAGAIGFRPDAEVTAGPGIDAKVTLTHTGDESAKNVSIRAELLDRAIDGAAVASIAPGQSQVWNFHLFDEIPSGSYVVVLRIRYSDANGYPFEVVSTAAATVGVKPAPGILGSVEVPRLAVNGEVTARLTAKKHPARSGSFDVRLVAPSGLVLQPDRLTLDFDPSGKATASFRVRNRELLADTSVNVYALVSGTDAGFPQVDTIRGRVAIGAPLPRATYRMFYEAAASVALLALALEGIAWASARRRQSG